MSQTKITINQIKQIVKDNVENVVEVKKMPASNTWFIFVKNNEDVNNAIKVLEETLGFEVFKTTKDAIAENKQHAKNIAAYFTQLPITFYERQMRCN